MKGKRQIACISALVLLSGAIGYFAGTTPNKTLSGYANQFGDINGDGEINASDAAIILQYAAYHGAGGDDSLEVWMQGNGKMRDISTAEPTDEPMSEPATDPDHTPVLDDVNKTLTIVGWNYDLMQYVDYYRDNGCADDVEVAYFNLDSTGVLAPEKLTTYLNSGEDVDLYFTEADWMRQFTDNPEYAMPLSELGITEADYSDAYPYAVEISKNSNGTLMAAAAEICPGFYAYNTDLASQYLGVTSPEQMQEKVSDWSKFEATAGELYSATGGSVTITATLGGMWDAYSSNTDSRWLEGTTLVTDQAEGFLEMARRFIDKGYVNPRSMQWTDDWAELSSDRSTLGYFYTTWTLFPASDFYAYDSGDTWNIVRGPENFFWGGNWLCASPACDTREAAADFLRAFTTDADRMSAYMNFQSERMGDGYYVCNNRTIVESLTGSNSLLGGQDPYPVIADAAQGIRWDHTMTTSYDLNLRNMFLSASDGYYEEPDEQIMKRYWEFVLYNYPELS